MYSILLHISGIAILEIIFYFYYIGPFESKSFMRAFKSTVKSLIDYNRLLNDNNIINIGFLKENITNDNLNFYLEDLKDKSDISKASRLSSNCQLFENTIIIWSIFFGISIIVFLICYLFKKYNTNDENENDNKNLIINGFKMNKISNNKTLYKVIKYFLLGGLILTFEYIFFQYVVLEYKIVTNDELQYVIISQLNKYILSDTIDSFN